MNQWQNDYMPYKLSEYLSQLPVESISGRVRDQTQKETFQSRKMYDFIHWYFSAI